jgi:solute carrier family 35 protein
MSSTKILGALFYAVVSILIMMVNKITLYVWGFPSVACLALAQCVFSIVSLRLMKAMGWITFPDPSWSSIKAVFPLPVLYVGNAVCGLSGTKTLSLPMFTVLRRTSIVLTMALERWLLGTEYSFKLTLSIVFILFGSIIAASLDMQFDLLGYAMTMLNNIFTSTGGVMTKMKLDTPTKEKATLNSMCSLMYTYSLVGAPLFLVSVLVLYPDTLTEAYHFEHWNNPQFVIVFLLSVLLGTLLQFSTFYCIKVNSALTTVVTGVLKNVLTSYVGMLDIRLGYTFNWMNFVGINLSMMGALWYTYIQFVENRKPGEDDDEEKKLGA